MKINQLIKKLNELKKKHGDIIVSIDSDSLQNCEDRGIVEIGTLRLDQYDGYYDPDTMRLVKKKSNTVVLGPTWSE